jgi:hypothetical protein
MRDGIARNGIALAWVLILAGAIAGEAPRAGPEPPAWLTDYDLARKVARASSKPL